MSGLAHLLFSQYRGKVLSLLLLHPEEQYHVREIARLTGTQAGTLHKELSLLATGGILTKTLRGNQVHYQANVSCPIYEELRSILRKTSGLVDVLADALAPLDGKIDAAFVFGSIAKGSETSQSDVDVLIIGNATFASLTKALHPAQAVLQREINPKLYSRVEWKKEAAKKGAFMREILNNPRLTIMGNDKELSHDTG